MFQCNLSSRTSTMQCVDVNHHFKLVKGALAIAASSRMASLAAQWPHTFMRTAQDVTLHYVDVGPRDALPVVLVHGWPDLWFGWRVRIHYLYTPPPLPLIAEHSLQHQIQALQSSYRLIVPGASTSSDVAIATQ